MYPFSKLVSVVAFLSGGQLAFGSILDRAQFIFAFGDSYTTEGWNGQGDPLGSFGQWCSTAGPNWVRQLNSLVNRTTLIDLAVSGATSDQSIVFASPPDFRSQTTSFLNFIVPNPQKVPWNRDNAIFLVAFGTNDVNNSFKNTAGNGTDLYDRDLNSYFTTVERLYAAGARQFVFNNVVPFDRAQAGVSQGPTLQAKLAGSIVEFNRLLAIKATSYCASKSDVKCLVFDTHVVFANIMDNYQSFGFVTPDGFCNAYAGRSSCSVEPADPSCLGPVSVYVWKDGLHPAWAADRLWAQGLLTQLSALP